MKRRRTLPLLVTLFMLGACAGEQSALSGGGAESGRTLLLTLILTIGAAIIFLMVVAALWIALAGPPRWKRAIANNSIVVWGGIVFPTVVLSVLLVYGFAALGAGSAATITNGEPALRIRVDGLQWWWRVTYFDDAGNAIESANELRLPAGRMVEIELTSSDVIHSFWVPAYAGKVDMIPGHTNTLTLVANEPGVVRGQCAEYCGGAHAMMAFPVITMEDSAFVDWLDAQAAPASLSGTAGERAFLEAGCGGCHTVRGTAATGSVGPDLTHVASRRTIAAGTLPANRAAFIDWLARHDEIKPENLMPAYDFFTDEDHETIATYLAGLD